MNKRENQHNLIQEIEQGNLSQLAYDQVTQRLDAIAETLHVKWENSKAADSEGREEAWKMLKAVKELRRSFEADIRDGVVASKQLEKLNG